METIYIKDDESALVDPCGRFIYEVCVFVKYENIYNLANHKWFTSEKEIPNIIRSLQIDPFIEVQCHLYSAPKSWLINNDFDIYVPKEKKKRIIKNKEDDKPKIEPVEYDGRRPTRKATKSRAKKL